MKPGSPRRGATDGQRSSLRTTGVVRRGVGARPPRRPSVSDPRGRANGEPVGALPSLDDLGAALPKIAKFVGSVVAPTTLLTALLLYFGRLHLAQFFQYFGVNFTALELTPQDYVIRSADGLFVPVAVAAATVLVVLWCHRVLASRLDPRRFESVVRVLTPAAAVVGVVCLGMGVVGIINPAVFSAAPELPGLGLSAGVLVLAYVSRLVRHRASDHGPVLVSATPPLTAAAIAEWAAVFILVAVGLFWAVGNYAAAVGTGRGSDMEAALATWPDAVLYSERSLSLTAPGVRETPCANGDAAYGFRYDGLKLVMQSGDQYLFLPSGWSRHEGAALLLPRSDTLRLEFTQPGASTAARPASC